MATPQFVPFPDADAAKAFSPVDDEPPLRWQRAVHLAPGNGLGVVRRAIFFALLTWLPIALWALVRGRFLDAATGESLLQHYGVHVRCLVAIPMFILGEITLHNAASRALPQFVDSGIVDDATRARFEAVVRTVRRWRNSTIPLAVHRRRRARVDVRRSHGGSERRDVVGARRERHDRFRRRVVRLCRPARSSSPCCSAGCGASCSSRC